MIAAAVARQSLIGIRNESVGIVVNQKLISTPQQKGRALLLLRKFNGKLRILNLLHTDVFEVGNIGIIVDH